MIGETLSHYRITGKLGEGGMGEVYLAEDTELDRKVAIKVLPGELSEDPERLERFKREAKAVAALNHPNIVTIYSIEENQGRRFLIMELVEGESLDRVLPPGGLPLVKVFDIAVPLADALSSAHEKGIVHRDLKPANVMITPDGRVKVLDFGLGQACGRGGSDASRCRRYTGGAVVGESDARRRGDGNGSLYVARAAPGQDSGSPVRHFFTRRGSLRDGQRSAAVSGREFGSIGVEHHAGHSGAGLRAAGGSAPASRTNYSALSRERILANAFKPRSTSATSSRVCKRRSNLGR